MRNRIFRGLLVLATTAVIVASVLIAVIMYQGSMATMQRDLRQEATYIKMGLEQGETNYLQALTAESSKLTRVTLIAPDGKVLYDNYVAAEKCSIIKTARKLKMLLQAALACQNE